MADTEMQDLTLTTTPAATDSLIVTVDPDGTPLSREAAIEHVVDAVMKKFYDDAVTADTLWADVIPAGFILEKIVFEETAGNSPILSLGTSDNATDIFEDMPITASTFTIVNINQIFSTGSAQSIDLNDAGGSGNWNSASLNVTLLMRRI